MNPQLILQNQFGEKTINSILGGSGALQALFTVDPTNGAGITGLLASPQISSIWMHTSTTPVTGSPNPAVGFAQINFSKGFLGYNALLAAIQSPASGTPILVTAGFTVGQAYIITAVGTTTVANWHSFGVPANVVPAVGVSFIASAATAGSGTGAVQVPIVSGVSDVEVVGNPVLTAAGGYIIVQFLGSTSSSVTTLIPKAPASGSVVALAINLDAPVGGPVL